MPIKNTPRHQMPREKLIEKGAENLKNSELLAILLRTGIKEKNVLDFSKQILKSHPLEKMAGLDYKSLVKIKGIEAGKACSLLAAFELAKRALDREDNSLPVINSAREAVFHLQEIRKSKKEKLVALFLNARNQLIHKEVISVGTLNANLIHPREIFKPAVDHLAASVILAHNHPSGDCQPSEEDLEITKRLQDAGEIMGIELLDHLILTEKDFQSLNKR
ncbi:MAG: DNA repair protein RadC [Candidatus Moranbacteria bacterium]|nr:DNA repair protein RadC [Candidatus Moranbacteria bacterium]